MSKQDFSHFPKKGREWMEKPIDKSDERRMDKIKWRRADNGKYFSYFDEIEDAYKYLRWVAHRYKHSRIRTLTVKDICEESQDRGIMLYPTQTGKWLNEVFEVNVVYTGQSPTDRELRGFTLDKEVADGFDELKKHSRYLRTEYFNIICRFMMGLTFDGLIIIFQGVPITLVLNNGSYHAITFAELPVDVQKYVDGLVYDADAHGLEYVSKKARVNGYLTIDGK